MPWLSNISDRFIPESFRWLFTKARYGDAESVIGKVSRMNGQQKPDISKIIDQAKLEEKEKRYYSAIDLFKTKDSVIKTLALIFIWQVQIVWTHFRLLYKHI